MSCTAIVIVFVIVTCWISLGLWCFIHDIGSGEVLLRRAHSYVHIVGWVVLYMLFGAANVLTNKEHYSRWPVKIVFMSYGKPCGVAMDQPVVKERVRV